MLFYRNIIEKEHSNHGEIETVTLDYQLRNMEIIDFQKFRIYLVAANPNSRMQDWIKYQEESQKPEKVEEMILQHQKEVNSLLENKYTPFSCIRRPSKYQLIFGHSEIDYQLEIYFISQNQYRIMYGMLGKCYSDRN